jgi:tetratricopeptide (TPR) repeat protein
MSKRFILFASLLALLGGSGVLIYYWYIHSDYSADVTEKDILSARRRLQGGMAPQPPPQQAILPAVDLKRTLRLAIGSLGPAGEDRNRELGDLVVSELSRASGLELVERQALDKVLSELNLTLAGLVRAKDAVAAGKLLRADWFLLGTEAKVAGTNSLVLRVVDARTGILRDAGVVSATQLPTQVAADIAGFVRLSRQAAATAKLRVYLAVGTFEDLSLNNRLADFPAQLRGNLMAAYRNSNVTLLEREYVEALLQEVRLDLAGLTQQTDTNAPQPMQSAFWLIDGQYQSYETTKVEVEMLIEIQRIFGPAKHFTVRAAPDGPASAEVKRLLDQTMNQGGNLVVPTRTSEARAQMELGKEIEHRGSVRPQTELVYVIPETTLDQAAAIRRQRNVEQAMRAFQTVLLLDPANREAKMHLAACLRNPFIDRSDEARNYYREIIEAPRPDQWTDLAKRALSASFGWGDHREAALWFERAAASSPGPAGEFYRREAEAAKAEVLLKSAGPAAQQFAEDRLWDSITNALFAPSVGGPMGVKDFVNTFGTDQAAAAQRLAQLYPQFRSRDPHLAPYVLAAIVSAQVDTNAPVVNDFQQMLQQFTARPDQVFRPDVFWWHISPGIWEWCLHHTNARLAVAALEGKFAAAAIYTIEASYTNHVGTVRVDDEDRIHLAQAYEGTQQWEKALRLFEHFAGQPFRDFGRVVFTDREADYCRRKLGLALPSKGIEFHMGKPVCPLCRDAMFTTGEEGLWLGLGAQLVHLGFDLKTNDAINLPGNDPAPIAAIWLTTSNIWLGTDGEGVYQFDKVTRGFHNWREKDGLLMDKVASLYLSPEALWIGYGRRVREADLKSAGGLGRLDLKTGQATSFTPSILAATEARQAGRPPATAPTRGSVLTLFEAPRGQIWFVSEDHGYFMLGRYRTAQNTWDGPFFSDCTSVLADSQHIVSGHYWNHMGEDRTGPLGVRVLELGDKDGKWRDLKHPERLPPGRVTAMALDGDKLWVGGFGYLALVDPARDEVRAVDYIQAETVDRLHIGGGYLWAQFRCGLYRATLADIYSAQASK